MADWIGGEWLAEATAWIEAELKQLGIVVVGAITQPHMRAWSTVLKVATNEGDVYFKATAPALASRGGINPDPLPVEAGVHAAGARRR